MGRRQTKHLTGQTAVDVNADMRSGYPALDLTAVCVQTAPDTIIVGQQHIQRLPFRYLQPLNSFRKRHIEAPLMETC